MADADRPLTDAQERLLIALSDADRDHAVGIPAGMEPPREWHELGSLGFRSDTARVLCRMDLVTVGTSRLRITEAGVAMLRSMGD